MYSNKLFDSKWWSSNNQNCYKPMRRNIENKVAEWLDDDTSMFDTLEIS